MNYTNANSIQLFIILLMLFIVAGFSDKITKYFLIGLNWIDEKLEKTFDKIDDWRM